MEYFLNRGLITATIAVLALPSCTFLPSSGPSHARIRSSAYEDNDKKKAGDYVLVTLDRKTADQLAQLDNVSSGNASDSTLQSALEDRLLRQGRPSSLRLPIEQTIAEGDTLNITIYDTGGALFAAGGTLPDGTKPTGAIPQPLPPQIVDSSGEISVPYAGRIAARGRTLTQIQKDIEEKLKSKTVDPQVIVTVAQRNGGDRVSVSGDVKLPSLVPVVLAGTRLLDALAGAGGSTGKEYETVVSVTRNGVTKSALLSDIFEKPSQNILLQIGDTVVVRVREQNFLSFGASGKIAKLPFANDHLSLVEAIALSGGPLDMKADPSGVFLYRVEKAQTVRRLGYSPVNSSSSNCQVIYRLDLTQANSLFVANNFHVRDGDILYVANANSIGWMKFLNLLNALTAPARSGLSTSTGIGEL